MLWILGMHNFTYWINNFWSQVMYGYNMVLGAFVWPIMFGGVIGYIYLKNQSFVSAAVGILIVVAAFSNAWIGMDILVNILFILVALALTGLLLLFLAKRRN